MTETETSLTVLIVGALLAQIALTVRVWRSQLYDREQKSAQTRLIWLLPVIGAVLVFALMPSEDLPTKRK